MPLNPSLPLLSEMCITMQVVAMQLTLVSSYTELLITLHITVHPVMITCYKLGKMFK